MNEMRHALQRAFSAEGPIIVEAMVDGAEYHELIARGHT
jgi:thiamine pyrophosphate-dependent acetolactate synthase large subunit-like protein